MVGTVLQKTRQNAQIFNSMYTYVIGNIPLLLGCGVSSLVAKITQLEFSLQVSMFKGKRYILQIDIMPRSPLQLERLWWTPCIMHSQKKNWPNFRKSNRSEIRVNQNVNFCTFSVLKTSLHKQGGGGGVSKNPKNVIT